MFDKICIKNFKAFSEWQDIDLAPITLIYGPNSSGKSSIIHSLMLLKQSLTRPNEQGGLVSNGEYVDLGDYGAMIHGHDASKAIGLRLSYLPDKSHDFDFNSPSMFGVKHKRSLELEYKHSGRLGEGGHDGFTYLKSISIGVAAPGSEEKIFSAKFMSRLESSRSSDPSKMIKIAKDFYIADQESEKSISDYVSKKGIPTERLKKLIDQVQITSDLNYATPSMVVPDRKISEKIGMDAAFLLNFALNDIARSIKNKFGAVTYLGPLRSHPSRFYAPRSGHDHSVGKTGENVARFIYEKSPEITGVINKWFSEFEIPYLLSAASIGNDISGAVICLQLKDLRTGVVVGPSDVGFGIGQLLPIIVEGIVRESSVICVEQPEIHLHPRLQAHLANFFVETSRKNQWIIETHSELLTLRLQKLIKAGKISPKDVSIIYVNPTNSGGEVIRIPLDKEGDFMAAWPEGFFEERIGERLRG